jgi:hypothetical protein
LELAAGTAERTESRLAQLKGRRVDWQRSVLSDGVQGSQWQASKAMSSNWQTVGLLRRFEWLTLVIFEVLLEFFNCVIGEVEVLWDRRRRRSCSGLRDQGNRSLCKRIGDS